MRGRLDGKVALISGTGGGQGRAAALRFAREGARVFGCDIDERAQRETLAMARDEGLAVAGHGCFNLGDPAQASGWIEAAVAQYGQIDILYNNASAARFGPIATMAVEDWHFTLRNELDLVFLCSRYAWPHLAARGGVIINVSSVAAWGASAVTGIGAHSAAKAGVVALTRQLAVEGAKQRIRAVSISPGVVATPGTTPFLNNPATRALLLEGIPMERPGEPDEIVATALFVASDEASYLTGTDIVVDGGMLAL
ncbi:SDR family NAD(P)-dependent oxidoreductase [Cupriavidus pinatubonensis]|uniref:Dihydroanticapsin 7-dehydrogenase n=1 Tax=Cupriavidus pinatubonensis TaxID=248026 RepID=A0ABN7Y0T8_9BURK|nr:SDR family NAD(P)-dependent oxidoreductase [Cupriavidus pinatubonensis]CAG9166094.1 Dihydroanticapsin 7-dehydrogenase [Cupriavidus pinatubonensis]